MGVHRITSESARYYAMRERIVGSAISIIGEASLRIDKLSREQCEKIGDLASKLLPYAPGYAGKTMPIIARLFWKLANVKEKDFPLIEMEKLEEEIEKLRKELGF
ncbi:MAG: hypothetical protein QXQ38_01325 [Archaeoglobaceae archaeon]|nr:hypothetical protein [Archaeoglobales archaeon]MDI9643471.1 hypothetical protein [Archaeoglobales archaeon]